MKTFSFLIGGLPAFLLFTLASSSADIISGGNGPTPPRPALDDITVLDAAALRKDSPDASVKQGLFSPTITYGEKAGTIHQTGARQTAIIETMEAQDKATGKAPPAEPTPPLADHTITLKGKAAFRIYATPFSPNVIAGDEKNAVLQNAVGATISGGGEQFSPNKIAGDYGTIGGGMDNEAGGVFQYLDAPFATVGGGKSNAALRRGAVVSGGLANKAEGMGTTVSGGQNNRAQANHTTISGGSLNGTFNDFATIGGGHTNQAIAKASSVLGGEFNRAKGVASAIGGGLHNETEGKYASIPGGSLNRANGTGSFAAGNRAHALHPGAFVWADQQEEDFPSTQANQVIIRASGNVGIDTNNPTEKLTVQGNIAPAQNNTHSIGTAAQRFTTAYIQRDINFKEQLSFTHEATPLMMLDPNGDLVLSGTIYASNFADREGRPITGASLDDVAELMALELQQFQVELKNRDQTIAAQQALIEQLDQRLRQLEAR